MSTGRWSEVGQEVMDSVLHAVESGDFTGLSKSVGDVIGETVDSIGRGMNQVGKEIERQAKARGMDTTGAAGVWTGRGSRQPSGRIDPGRQTEQNMQGQEQRSNRQDMRRPGRVLPAGSQFPARYKRFLPGQAAGPALLAVGIVGTSMFGIAALLSLIACMVERALYGLPVGFCIAMAPFIWMITRGAGMNGRNHRFRNYVRAIGDRGYCAIEELARAAGRKKEYVRKDLQDMLRRGYFLEGHLDREETTLIVDHETFRQYTQAEEERLRRAQEEARVQQERTEQVRQEEAVYTDEVHRILTEGEAYIRHVHACNDAISGVAMSEKLEKLEDIMRRIFAQVKKQPESAGDLHKFMTYYLPTTTKLIDAYRDLDEQPAYGTNVANTKKEIEATLDMINEAFVNLFDSLFEETAWDISADISTMKVMLQQEGLTGNKDFG